MAPQFNWGRHGEAETNAKAEGVTRDRMRQGIRQGPDYTPLYRFLLSKPGQDWGVVHSEAVARLDHEDPIFHMVARHPEDRKRFFRSGENSYFSGLYVDAGNWLALVDPNLEAAQMRPKRTCCTHTLNGLPFGLAFDPENPWGNTDDSPPPD